MPCEDRVSSFAASRLRVSRIGGDFTGSAFGFSAYQLLPGPSVLTRRERRHANGNPGHFTGGRRGSRGVDLRASSRPWGLSRGTQTPDSAPMSNFAGRLLHKGPARTQGPALPVRSPLVGGPSKREGTWNDRSQARFLQFERIRLILIRVQDETNQCSL
jgi:hypothetical protein